MPSRAFVEMEDYDGEKSSVQWWVQDISAANYGSVTVDIDEFKDAIITVTLGVVRDNGFRKSFGEDFTSTVSDVSAQRESKWLVHIRDTTQFLDAVNTIANPGYGKMYTMELPTADLSLLLANDEKMDIVGAVGAAFVTSLEANIRSPWNHTGNAPTQAVTFIEHVGRNV